jgi:hypothetical protein
MLTDEYEFLSWDSLVMSRVFVKRKSDGAEGYIDLLQDCLFLAQAQAKYSLTYKPDEYSHWPMHFNTFVSFSLRNIHIADDYDIVPVNNGEKQHCFCRYIDKRWEYIPHSRNLSGFIYRPDRRRFSYFAKIFIHCCSK